MVCVCVVGRGGASKKHISQVNEENRKKKKTRSMRLSGHRCLLFSIQPGAQCITVPKSRPTPSPSSAPSSAPCLNQSVHGD